MIVPTVSPVVPPPEGVSQARSASDGQSANAGRGAPAGTPSGGAPDGALGNTRIEFHPPSDTRRLARFDRRAKSARALIADHLETAREMLVSPSEAVNVDTGEVRTIERAEARTLLPPRVARCSWALGQLVTLHGSPDHPAHYSGTERCGSISACAVCAPVIRAERAREISDAVTQHQKNGGFLVFVTLTIRHQAKHQLSESLDAVIGGWQRLLRGKAWMKFKQRHDITGYVRALEITRGQSGWHPHIHAIFFLDTEPTPASLAEFESKIFTRWSSIVTRENGDFAPTAEHGIDCQLVDKSGEVLAKYVSKLQEEKTSSWGVDAELTRGDLKDGRKSSLIPFELIDTDQTSLWVEYVKATKGRRIITWSKGLKDRFGVNERDDDEILDEVEQSPLAWTTHRRHYESTRKTAPVLLAVALDAVESQNFDLLAQLLPGSRPLDSSTAPE